MEYFILTARSLIWMLLGIVATLSMFGALMSPSWLVAKEETFVHENETVTYRPSVGVYAKCSKMERYAYPVCTLLAVSGLATDSYVFPTIWKASFVFIVLGISIMSVTVLMGIASCCFQSIFKKSIFTISGAAQACAGISYILGVILHPMGWGSPRVQKLCGRDSSAMYPDNCSIGVGLWLAIIGTLLTFTCACLSLPAEKSTSSDKVQDKIYEGQRLICIT